MKPLDAGIVGCGTAGPAAALFLARQGHRVTLYERVAELGSVGAGIILQPSGMAVLDELGLLAPVLARGAPLDGLRCDLGAHELVVVCDGAKSQLRDGSPLVKRASPYRWGALWFVADDPERRFHRELYHVVNGTRRLLGLLPTGLGVDGTTAKVSLFWSIRADCVDAFRSGDFAEWKAEVLAYAPDAGPVRCSSRFAMPRSCCSPTITTW